MFTYNSPQEFAVNVQKHLLPALRYHFSNDQRSCEDCPYWTGPGTDHCHDSFEQLLPDVLRRYDDPRAVALADRLDICNAYLSGEADDDICAGCPHFHACRVEEDPDPVVRDVYQLLLELGAYEEKA